MVRNLVMQTMRTSTVGCAVWCSEEFFRMSARLPDLSTIFTAEGYAILFALRKS